MKIVEKKTITIATEYIADDGTVFDTAQSCEEYETEEIRKKAIERIKHLKVEEKTPPLSMSYVNDDHEFIWYAAHSEYDLVAIATAYEIDAKSIKATKFPALICIEDDCGSYYSYTLEECARITTLFWEKFGYKAILQEAYESVKAE